MALPGMALAARAMDLKALDLKAPVARLGAARVAVAGARAASTGRMYDPKTVETVKGEVVSVEKFTPAKGMSAGVHLLLKTGKETISVHLGPTWYLENQDAQVEPRDKIEITGSRLILDGKPVLIAAEVKKGDGVLKLRDENGVPMWAGWRKR